MKTLGLKLAEEFSIQGVSKYLFIRDAFAFIQYFEVMNYIDERYRGCESLYKWISFTFRSFFASLSVSNKNLQSFLRLVS
ncbi:hypothetical protein [Bacillus luti]|uniref:hypothetical protein n=1 Tax=Bacillus luti TaxID=2026191 RepID=UPI003D025A47